MYKRQHKGHGHKEDKHDDHKGHAHGEHDPHIWLDPMNAKVILSEMAEHLIENDQENASKYKVFPGLRVAPKGSITPVLIFVSFATALIISGLN